MSAVLDVDALFYNLAAPATGLKCERPVPGNDVVCCVHPSTMIPDLSSLARLPPTLHSLSTCDCSDTPNSAWTQDQHPCFAELTWALWKRRLDISFL